MKTLPMLFAGCTSFNFEALLEDPDKLGAFLSLCRMIEELHKQAEDAAIALVLKKIEIPGFTLCRRDGNAYVEPETVLELVQGCTLAELARLLPAIVQALGSIGEERYLKLCAAADQGPRQEAIKRSGATLYLRRKTEEDFTESEGKEES
jgi:hypothetical protein